MLCRLHCVPPIMLMAGFTERAHYLVPKPRCSSGRRPITFAADSSRVVSGCRYTKINSQKISSLAERSPDAELTITMNVLTKC